MIAHFISGRFSFLDSYTVSQINKYGDIDSTILSTYRFYERR
jgi:hypothetical protein